MSPLDTGFPRDPGPRKRMLPSVTDVVRELAKTVSADPAVLFKAARSVVAEELSKVKQGLEAVPLGVLVKRARLQLEREGEVKPISDAALPAVPAFPARPVPSHEAPGVSSSPSKPTPPHEPFQEAESRTEPDWKKEDPVPPEEAPFRSAMIPIPRPGRMSLEIPVPAPENAMPRPAEGPAPALPLEPPPEREVPEPSPDFFAPPPEVPRAPAEAFLTRSQGRSERSLRAPTPPPARHEPGSKSMSEMPPLRELFPDNPKPVADKFPAKAKGPAPKPARSSRKGWLVAIALVVVIGAGLAWAVREYVFKNEIVKPVVPVARRKPDATPPVSVAPAPAPSPAPAFAEKPAAPKAAPPPARATAEPVKQALAPVPRGRAAVLLTPDWAGRPVVYVIHFSSHKDRESATKEARKLGAALGAPAHAVEVDLGEKGVWYRVVLGEFADVETARAFRADLESKKTPGMGFVYEMRGR
jgi:hypothetical protein